MQLRQNNKVKPGIKTSKFCQDYIKQSVEIIIMCTNMQLQKSDTVPRVAKLEFLKH